MSEESSEGLPEFSRITFRVYRGSPLSHIEQREHLLRSRDQALYLLNTFGWYSQVESSQAPPAQSQSYNIGSRMPMRPSSYMGVGPSHAPTQIYARSFFTVPRVCTGAEMHIGAGSAHATGMFGSSHVATPIFEGLNTNDLLCFSMDELCGTDGNTNFDILGSSQIGGAQLYPSQNAPTQTLLPEPRPTRDVASPDRFTYSEGHVRAQDQTRRTHRRGEG